MGRQKATEDQIHLQTIKELKRELEERAIQLETANEIITEMNDRFETQSADSGNSNDPLCITTRAYFDEYLKP